MWPLFYYPRYLCNFPRSLSSLVVLSVAIGMALLLRGRIRRSQSRDPRVFIESLRLVITHYNCSFSSPPFPRAFSPLRSEGRRWTASIVPCRLEGLVGEGGLGDSARDSGGARVLNITWLVEQSWRCGCMGMAHCAASVMDTRHWRYKSPTELDRVELTASVFCLFYFCLWNYDFT